MNLLRLLDYRQGISILLIILDHSSLCWTQTQTIITDGKSKDNSNKIIKFDDVKGKEDAYIIDHQNDDHRTPIIIEETDEVYEPETEAIDMKHNVKDDFFIPIQPKYSPPSSYAHLKIEQPNPQIMVHVVPPGTRRKYESSVPDLLAVLAPLAVIPLLSSFAMSTFSTLLTLHGLGRRRKRDLSMFHNNLFEQLHSPNVKNFNLTNLAEHDLASVYHNNLLKLGRINKTDSDRGNETNQTYSSVAHDLPLFENLTENSYKNQTMSSMSELFQLDIVQQYLRQSGRPDHNDQIIASYLECRGMFTTSNHCLERLACHYGDMHNGRLRPLERDVAALIIYSLLRNTHIDNSFKRRLQRAALFGYDHTSNQSSASYETSFVPICDREFPCPRSEMP